MARLINFGAGEICDRLSILALKLLYGSAAEKDTAHWEKERAVLLTKISARTLNGSWFASYTELAAVNAAIWQNEDALRALRAALTELEHSEAISTRALTVAFRSQELNDRRNELIEAINKEVGDHLGSEKLV